MDEKKTAIPGRRESALFLVDNRPLRRAAILTQLEGVLAAEVAAVASADELLAAAGGERLSDVVVLLSLGDLPFTEYAVLAEVERIRSHLPAARLAVLSDRVVSQAELTAARRAGVRGFIPTRLEPAAVRQALRTIAAGGVFYPPTAPHSCRPAALPNEIGARLVPQDGIIILEQYRPTALPAEGPSVTSSSPPAWQIAGGFDARMFHTAVLHLTIGEATQRPLAAVRVLSAFVALLPPDSPELPVGRGRLALEARCTPADTSRALSDLERLGVLIRRGRGKAARYVLEPTLKLPAEPPPASRVN